MIRLLQYPSIDGDQLKSVAKTIEGEKLLLFYRMKSKDEKEMIKETLHPGIMCKMAGEFDYPKKARNPNAFNYEQYLRTQKIHRLFTADSIIHCEVAKRTFHDYLLMVRQKSIEQAEKHYPKEIYPFVTALLFGEKEGLDEDILGAYQNLGLSHLLAISGLHITILSACIYYLFVRLGITRETTRNLLLLFLPIYSILAGGAPSVNRAVLMAWLILFFMKWRSKVHSLDALGFSFLLFILINPYQLFHVGFQLSYVVTASLLLSRDIIGKQKHWLFVNASVSFIAQLASLPIILLHFFEFSIVSTLVNIIYVPFYSVVILPLCLLSFVLLFLFPSVSSFIISIFSIFLSSANKLAQGLAKLPYLSVLLGKPSLLLILLFYVCFISAFILFEKHGWKMKKKMIYLLCFPFIIQLLVVKWSPIGEITFIDVGQGDSIFIQLPFSRGNYLIDTGGVIRFPVEEWKQRKNSFDPGERIVVPYLKSKGISRIDRLILTHGDMDHIGSSMIILNEMNVKEVLVGKTEKRKSFEEEIMQFAMEKNIRVTEAFEGMRWGDEKTPFYILSPKESAVASNDSSIVIYAKIGGFNWLFTGDMEREGELRLIHQYEKLPVDILKAGHHGSKTSSSEEFLAHISPKIAIISAGENNRYGHPHHEVLENFERNEIIVLRTDKLGAIAYTFFHNKGHFRTMLND